MRSIAADLGRTSDRCVVGLLSGLVGVERIFLTPVLLLANCPRTKDGGRSVRDVHPRNSSRAAEQLFAGLRCAVERWFWIAAAVVGASWIDLGAQRFHN